MHADRSKHLKKTVPQKSWYHTKKKESAAASQPASQPKQCISIHERTTTQLLCTVVSGGGATPIEKGKLSMPLYKVLAREINQRVFEFRAIGETQYARREIRRHVAMYIFLENIARPQLNILGSRMDTIFFVFCKNQPTGSSFLPSPVFSLRWV